VAHEAQLYVVPDELDDDAAVMVEPTACAVHAALRAAVPPGGLVTVIGAGTVGLLCVAALNRLASPGTLIVAAKHPEQRAAARRLGATDVAAPEELARAVRRADRCQVVGERLSGGADVVLDCVGSDATIEQALALTRPGGRVVLVGMPGRVRVDLAPLWQREIDLVGAYAYGEERVEGRVAPTFVLAMELVDAAGLGSLVSARYPLEQYREALEHAANAGRRGATKIVFDLRARRR
jgi:threonine dehydrogenase-like Zn-dependent dehydrogenase